MSVYATEELNKVAKYVQEHGVSGLADYLKDKTCLWKDDSVNPNISGMSVKQKKALVQAIGHVSKEVIKAKSKLLKKLLPMKCTVSAAGSAAGSLIPIPVLGIVYSASIDTILRMHENKLYIKVFGLDENAVVRLLDITTMSVERYAKSLCAPSMPFQHQDTLLTPVRTTIKKESVKRAQKKATDSVASIFFRVLPFVGVAVAVGASFKCCYDYLVKRIDELEFKALAIIDAAIERIQSQI